MKVEFWYNRYAAFVAAIECAVSLVGIWFVVQRQELAPSAGLEEVQLLFLGMLWFLTFLFLGVVHIAAARTPRQPWAWSIRAVIVGLDLTTLILWPIALPMLWRWLKKDVQAYYGREV